MNKKKTVKIEKNPDPDHFTVFDESALLGAKPTNEFKITALDGYDIPNTDIIVKIPIVMNAKLLMPYRHIDTITLAIKELSIPTHYKLRLNIAKSFADRGVILLEEMPWLTNEVKQITIGHIGKQIVEIANGDFLFVGWLEKNIILE